MTIKNTMGVHFSTWVVKCSNGLSIITITSLCLVLPLKVIEANLWWNFLVLFVHYSNCYKTYHCLCLVGLKSGKKFAVGVKVIHHLVLLQ